jgi:mRNA interferase MazF
MPLQIHPQVGAVLVCDFDPGFREPEMVKRRPVIVVSPRLRRRDGLCTVVPLSTTPPNEEFPYHYRISFTPLLPKPYDAAMHWVKADMLYTVGFHRLFPLRRGRDEIGRRQYDNRVIGGQELTAIRRCILYGLGMQSLTVAL